MGRVLREAVAAGVNHIDTSDFYGPHVTNQIIRQALHPYPRRIGNWHIVRSPPSRELGRRAVDLYAGHLGGVERHRRRGGGGAALMRQAQNT